MNPIERIVTPIFCLLFFAATLVVWPVTLLYAWHRRWRLARWAGISPAAAQRQERHIRGRT